MITFTLLSGGDHRFEVDQQSGTVRVSNLGVDREVSESYELMVRAMDNGGRLVSGTVKPCTIVLTHLLLQSNTVTVSVTILDCNDNPPLFTNPPYEVTIDEHTAMGTAVLEMLHTDGDRFTAAFSTVVYVFDGGFGVQFGHFDLSTSVSAYTNC